MVHGGKLTQELSNNSSVRRFLRVLQQAGRAISFPDNLIEQEIRNVNALGLCVSNDEHIIALARISGARTLCSNDTDLHTDFKNRELVSNPRGRIYQNAEHKSLLEHTQACKAATARRAREA